MILLGMSTKKGKKLKISKHSDPLFSDRPKDSDPEQPNFSLKIN